MGPHCLPVCKKNSFEKFARIFSRRHKQTTFSDAVFLGALRVKNSISEWQMQGQILLFACHLGHKVGFYSERIR